jgi:endoribonuclease LACTB2
MTDLPLHPLAPGLWRLPLPSRTMPPFEHTNHFVVQAGGVGALVEAGFADPQDASRIRTALEQTGVRFLKAVLLTHTHPDHVAGLGALRQAFPEVPVFVHPAELPRLELPDLRALQDGRVLTVGDLTVTALHTPGHSPGHLSYYLEDSRTVLAGDLVAGQGSSWVGHPEGDVAEYLASLERLRSLKLRALAPGHGEPTQDPYTKLNEARRHRLARLEQVHAALQEAPRTLTELRALVYPDVPEALERLTEMSLLALLKKLMSDLRVLHLGEDESGPYAARR